jgi:uncharacterized membrane protein SpoIIM required for sporulation
VAHAAAPRGARPDLGLTYPPASERPHDALTIFINNGRVGVLVLGATVLAATVPRTAPPFALLLAAIAALNVGLISAALLADGPRAGAALLPHGALELLAYSLAGAGFTHAHERGPASDVGLLVTTTAATIVLLGLAALTEVSAW